MRVWLRRSTLVACIVAGQVAPAQNAPEVASYKKLSLAELMDIEVTSVSRRAEPLAESASAVQVVTGEGIRRAGVVRLPNALRLLSNLQVAQIDSRQWAVAARGFNSTSTNKLLVQLDGRTLYTPLFAGVFWDVQDTLFEDIDRIEAISGPGATQWGANAVNGVINITTKNARHTQGAFVTGTVGTELATGAVRYGGIAGPGVYYRVYGKHTEGDSSITPAGADGNDSWHRTQGGFRADWERPSGDRVTVQGDAYRGRIDQPGDEDLRVSGANVLGRWVRKFSPFSSLNLQSYFDYTHRAIPASITEHLGILDFDLQHHLSGMNGDNLIWGAGYRGMNDRVANSPAVAFLPAKVRREWLSGFIQGERALLADRLRAMAGLQVEYNPYTGIEWQPSARAMWKWRERHRLWAAVSRAVRTPSRIDRELFAPASPPFSIAGGPNFESEKLLAYEVGYRAEPRTNLAVALSTFFHDYDDLRSLEPSRAPGGPSVIANGLRGKVYGAELTMDSQVRENWRLNLGYTELRVHSTPKPGSLDQTSARSQALDPRRTAVLRSQLDLPARTAWDVVARYVGEIANQGVPAYFEVDVRFSWRPRDALELSVFGRNLLDAQHPEFGPMATRREIERNFNAAFAWRF